MTAAVPSEIPEEMTFGVPAEPPVPVSVTLFAPTPEAKMALDKVNTPLPEASIVAPPVVPARSMTRSVDSLEEPVHLRVPVFARSPMAMVAPSVVVGAPRPPATPTLPIFDTLRVPFLMKVWPV